MGAWILQVACSTLKKIWHTRLTAAVLKSDQGDLVKMMLARMRNKKTRN